MPDPIALLTQDHREVDQTLTQLEDIEEPDQRRPLVDKVLLALAVHMQIEEEILYPFIRAEVDDGDEMMEEAETEHEGGRVALDLLEDQSPDGPGFDQAVVIVKAGIGHHVEEEESEVFPKLRESASAERLDQLGAELQAAKERYISLGLNGIRKQAAKKTAKTAGKTATKAAKKTTKSAGATTKSTAKVTGPAAKANKAPAKANKAPAKATKASAKTTKATTQATKSAAKATKSTKKASKSS